MCAFLDPDIPLRGACILNENQHSRAMPKSGKMEESYHIYCFAT